MSINTVVLTGRLTKDVDLRITNTGKSVASFTLAVDRNYKSDQQADFLNVSVWGKQAENPARNDAKSRFLRVAAENRTNRMMLKCRRESRRCRAYKSRLRNYKSKS